LVHVGIESQALSEQKSFLKGKGKKGWCFRTKEKKAKLLMPSSVIVLRKDLLDRDLE